MGDLGADVTEWLAEGEWKKLIPLRKAEDMDGWIRVIRHTKQDLVLADVFSEGRTVVCPIDFTIAADGDIEGAAIRKEVRHHPLCEVIRRHLR